MQNRLKRLAIISDCIHMFDEQNNVVTENHIFCRQMQALAAMFQQTVICCPFVPYTKDKVTTTYINSTIQFVPVPNVGGNTLKKKLGIVANIAAWLRAFRKAGKGADIIYMRFPNNLNIIGFFYFYFKRAKTFATYTGTWKNYAGEPLTYRFQKWLIKNLLNGPAWVYINEDKIGRNLFKGISPSYTLSEWEEETQQVQQRVAALETQAITNPVFITVGGLNTNKNQQYILDACKILNSDNIGFHLYVVGDGELKTSYEKFVNENNLQHCITICGKKTYTQLRELYRKSDFLIQATLVEGFGKVPIEGFFHGVVPLLNKVALAEEMTGNGTRGFIFSANNPGNLVVMIKDILKNQQQLKSTIYSGRNYAKHHTLEEWSQSYIKKINEYFG